MRDMKLSDLTVKDLLWLLLCSIGCILVLGGILAIVAYLFG